MSEKFEGIRVLWNGNSQLFYCRNGKIIKPPKFFIDSIPNNIILDGELW